MKASDCRYRRRGIAIRVLSSCVALGLVLLAGHAAFSASAQLASSAQPPDYQPTIADLMTLGVQPRHIKMGLALRDQNWAYAAYETNELKNVLNRIIRAVPTIDRKFDTAALVQSSVAMPLRDLADAIKVRDISASTAAYAALTAACTACHQAVNHGAIVIKVPREDAFPDQEFRGP